MKFLVGAGGRPRNNQIDFGGDPRDLKLMELDHGPNSGMFKELIFV